MKIPLDDKLDLAETSDTWFVCMIAKKHSLGSSSPRGRGLLRKHICCFAFPNLDLKNTIVFTLNYYQPNTFIRKRKEREGKEKFSTKFSSFILETGFWSHLTRSLSKEWWGVKRFKNRLKEQELRYPNNESGSFSLWFKAESSNVFVHCVCVWEDSCTVGLIVVPLHVGMHW